MPKRSTKTSVNTRSVHQSYSNSKRQHQNIRFNAFVKSGALETPGKERSFNQRWTKKEFERSLSDKDFTFYSTGRSEAQKNKSQSQRNSYKEATPSILRRRAKKRAIRAIARGKKKKKTSK
ncbi:MAG: hypothetical protein GY737_00350 [Desulfobacteraceae bacterium]|nr:hypothetical protein [Desulfobacteraceae bacterium]